MTENLPEEKNEEAQTKQSQVKPAEPNEVELPLQWQAPEYEHRPKSPEWFWIVASGALAVIIASILMGNFLFAVFAFVAAFALYAFNKKKPEEITFSIGIKGVKAGDKFYPYQKIDSFSINFDPPLKKEIILESKKLVSTYITLPLGDTNPNTARRVLLKFLKEKEHESSLIET